MHGIEIVPSGVISFRAGGITEMRVHFILRKFLNLYDVLQHISLRKNPIILSDNSIQIDPEKNSLNLPYIYDRSLMGKGVARELCKGDCLVISHTTEMKDGHVFDLIIMGKYKDYIDSNFFEKNITEFNKYNEACSLEVFFINDSLYLFSNDDYVKILSKSDLIKLNNVASFVKEFNTNSKLAISLVR